MTKLRSRVLGPAVLAALASMPIACGGGGEHEPGHGEGHVEVHVGRVPPAPLPEPALDPAKLRERAAKVLGVLPEEFTRDDNPGTDEKIALGRMLYYEPRLSLSGELSCNSCHLLDNYGVDSLATSPGHEGTLGERNSPTVYNAGGHFVQFWDGRAADLEEQAKGPILNPIEMAMPDEATVVARLQAIPGYVEAFATAFPEAEEPITYDNVARAIAAFERRLITPSSFDVWLGGDDSALSEAALAGLKLFLDTDCQSCHSGFNLGGSSYQKLGTEKSWDGLKDVGRVAISGDERDRFVFKVPTLRNVAKTGPYLHDGSIMELPDMIGRMVAHQTKRAGPLSEAEMQQMLAFLDALTGELPSEYIAKPELPADAEVAPAEVAPAEVAPAEPKPSKPKPAKPADGGE